MSAHYPHYPRSQVNYFSRVRMTEEKRMLVTSLANGFDFAALNGDDRKWLRRRRLVNQTGTVTDKGRAWSSVYLAEEADRLMAGEVCQDFGEE
jgi:hypothetical protein